MQNELVLKNNQLETYNTQAEVEKQRVMQEVQALVLVAQKCPRDEVKAHKRIMDAAKRQTLAEGALYAYPRGGQIIKGPSIRTAETIAKYWGNISFGIKELSQNNTTKESEMMAYAWDLETNVRQEKVFKVPYKRYSKSKGLTNLDDPRDIYEMTANQGARRLRTCILGLIPTDIIEDFVKECEKTLAGTNSKPLKDRVKEMIKAFEGLGVTQAQVEKRLGCKSSSFIERHLVDLRAIYKSIKDNFQTINDYFEKEIAPVENAFDKQDEKDEKEK